MKIALMYKEGRVRTWKNQQKKMLLCVIAAVFMAAVSTLALPTNVMAATTWQAHPASSDAAWRGVTWSPELGIFVAVGTAAGADGVMTSPDGINWTTQTAATEPGFGQLWRGVTWSPELHLFVAVGNASPAGTNVIMTSPDGVTWTMRNAPVVVGLFAVTWSPELGIFVATRGPSGGTALTSPDGINWTQAATPPTTSVRNVIWVAEDSQFVAAGNPATTLFTSPDGNIWTPRTAPLTSLDVAYSATAGLYVAVGSGGIMTSPDAVTWTTQTSPVTNLQAVEWSPISGEFAAVGAGGIVTSPDGINWTEVTSPEANTWDAITWSSELSRFVAISTNGTNRTMVGLVPTVPNAPINLTGAVASDGINLSWTTPTFDGNSPITGYRIERSTNGGPFEVIAANTNSTSTSYTDTTVAGGNTYAYRIYALNAEGSSVASNEITLQMDAAAGPDGQLADTGQSQPILIGLAAAAVIVGLAIAFRQFKGKNI